MAFYQNEEDARLTVDFGNGRSVTFKMRGTDLDIATTRRLGNQAQQNQMIESRLKILKESAKKDNIKDTEFAQSLDEIEKLVKRGDQTAMMVDFVYNAASGWVDYYADKKAEEKNELVPFTKENIEKMGIVALGKVVVKFNEFFGFGEAQDSDMGKAPSTNSQPQLQSAALEPPTPATSQP